MLHTYALEPYGIFDRENRPKYTRAQVHFQAAQPNPCLASERKTQTESYGHGPMRAKIQPSYTLHPEATHAKIITVCNRRVVQPPVTQIQFHLISIGSGVGGTEWGVGLVGDKVIGG